MLPRMTQPAPLFPSDLALDRRAGLPDALRVLLNAHPRGTWQAHPHFGGMVQFWLDRHLMFRDLTARLRAETEAHLDTGTDPRAYAARLSRMGGFFLNQLHGHHQIEDRHYFPELIRLDTRLERGFQMLESDHDAIDGHLHAFAEAANAVLAAVDAPAAARDAAGAFLDRMDAFDRLLDRHLTDEEDLVVPVVLATGFDG